MHPCTRIYIHTDGAKPTHELVDHLAGLAAAELLCWTGGAFLAVGSLDTVVELQSPAAMAAFADDLARAVAGLADHWLRGKRIDESPPVQIATILDEPVGAMVRVSVEPVQSDDAAADDGASQDATLWISL